MTAQGTISQGKSVKFKDLAFDPVEIPLNELVIIHAFDNIKVVADPDDIRINIGFYPGYHH